MTAFVLSVCFSSANTALAQFLGTSKIIISEYRLDGPNGPSDEFVEIVNNSNFALTIVSSDAGNLKGWSVMGIVAGNPTKICTIPYATLLRAGQHYLCAKTPGYELAGYSQGPDDNIASYTAIGLDADGGVALFSSEDTIINSDGTFFSPNGTVFREDAVGFKKLNSATFALSFLPAFLEPYMAPSAGLNPIGRQDPASRAPNFPNDVREYSFVRKHTNVGGFGRWNGPTYQDLNINTSDWVLVSNVGDLVVNQAFVANSATNTSFPGSTFDPSPVGFAGTEIPTIPVFGAPGPQSSTSPVERNYNTQFIRSLLDPGSLSFLSPNRVQIVTPVCGGPQGYLILRFTYKNMTGFTQNNLRVRWIDVSTINRGNLNYPGVLDLLDSIGPAVKTLPVVLTSDLLTNDPFLGPGSPFGDGITNANAAGGAGNKRFRSTYVEGVNKTPQVLGYAVTSPPTGFGVSALIPGFGSANQSFKQVNPTWTDLGGSPGTPCRVGGFNSATVAKPPTLGITTTALPAQLVPGGSISLEHRFGIIQSGGFTMMGIIESN
jgi:hypothetical protein